MGNEHGVFPIKIRMGGVETPYSPEFQTEAEFARSWISVLRKAHAGNADVRCLCPGPGEKRLSPHRLNDSDRIYLARYPYTGPEHAPECIFYATDPAKSGLGAYAKDVVEEGRDGLKIKLAIGLKKKDPASGAAGEEKANHSGTRTSKPAMTPLGLLHLLWTKARLNLWYPAMEGKRTLDGVHRWLDEQAKGILAGKATLADSLLVATENPDGIHARKNQSRSDASRRDSRRLVVIAPFAAHSPEREACAMGFLPIKGFHGIPRLRVASDLWKSRRSSFEAEIAAWRQGAPTIAIAQTDPPGRNNCANIVDIALMGVTPRWIPVASGFEAMLEELLYTEHRAFLKPLRFDAARDVVFPDFELLDMGSPCPMEVFGRMDESYEIRKMEKQAYYRTQYGVDAWWSWDAARHPNKIPPLPRKKGLV